MKSKNWKTFLIANDFPLWSHIFSDIENTGGGIFAYPYSKSADKKEKILFRLCNNRYVRQVAQGVWLRYVFKKWGLHKNDKNLILILNPVLTDVTVGFLRLLEKEYRAEIAVLFIDTIHCLGESYLESVRPLLNYVGNRVYSYDYLDAQRMGWKHTFQYYSVLPMRPCPIDYDVFMVIHNKGRAESAVSFYDHLTSRNISCLFYINGVSEEFLRTHERPGIIYNRFIDYQQVLDHVSHCRVIVELSQEGQNSNTLRAFEAVAYNKKLITNNPTIANFPHYDPNFMKYFSDVADLSGIDDAFFKSDEELPDYRYAEEFSPLNLVSEIMEAADRREKKELREGDRKL